MMNLKLKETYRWLCLLCFMYGALCLYASVAEATDIAQFEYADVNGSIKITKYNGGDTNVTIPSTIAGKPVRIIGKEAFYSKSLRTVTIPTSVTTIEESAFFGTRLTSVTIPNGVKFIGDAAFRNSKITALTLADSVVWIGKNAFHSTAITTVEFPENVTTIGQNAFAKTSLTSATFKNSLVAIENGAFNVTTSDTFAFHSCDPSNAKEYALANSITFEATVENCSAIVPVPFEDEVANEVTLPTGTGSIELQVFKHDKKTAMTGPLNVTITSKSGYVYTTEDDQLVDGKFTSVTTLPKETFYVTISNGTLEQTAEVKVANKKATAKLYWAASLSDIQDEKGVIKKSGAIQGLVYNGTGPQAQLTSNTTVTIVSKATRWTTKTDQNGKFNVYVPTGTYDIIVSGLDESKKNTLYSKIKVTAGQAAAPLETLNAGLAWGDDDKTLGFSLNEDSLTANSKTFTGKAAPLSTVSLYTVEGNVRTWISDVKVKKTGAFSIKAANVSDKAFMFIVRDAANNEYVSPTRKVLD